MLFVRPAFMLAASGMLLRFSPIPARAFSVSLISVRFSDINLFMKITKITVIKNQVTGDTVLCETDLPPATWPQSQGHMAFHFHAAYGEDYARHHFPGIPIEIIKV
jgi:hypothetical protein